MHFNLYMVENLTSKFPTRNNHYFILWGKSRILGTMLTLVGYMREYTCLILKIRNKCAAVDISVFHWLLTESQVSTLTENNTTCVYLQLLLISFAFKIYVVKMIRIFRIICVMHRPMFNCKILRFLLFVRYHKNVFKPVLLSEQAGKWRCYFLSF